MHTATATPVVPSHTGRTIPSTLIGERGPIDTPPGLAHPPAGRTSDPALVRPVIELPAAPMARKTGVKSAEEWVQQLEMKVVQPDRIQLVRMRLDLAKHNLIYRHDHTPNGPFMDRTLSSMVEVESTLRTLVELGLMTHDGMRLELLQLSTDMKRPVDPLPRR